MQREYVYLESHPGKDFLGLMQRRHQECLCGGAVLSPGVGISTVLSLINVCIGYLLYALWF